MKINITKEQYWHLLRSVYIADWIANAICERDMKEDEDIKKVRNHVFSFAKDFGYDDFVTYDDELKSYFSTWDLDDESSTREIIERYDEHIFWEELSERMGERDFHDKYKPAEIEKMSDEERFTKHMKCQIVWEKELEKNGVERIELDTMGD